MPMTSRNSPLLRLLELSDETIRTSRQADRLLRRLLLQLLVLPLLLLTQYTHYTQYTQYSHYRDALAYTLYTICTTKAQQKGAKAQLLLLGDSVFCVNIAASAERTCNDRINYTTLHYTCKHSKHFEQTSRQICPEIYPEIMCMVW